MITLHAPAKLNLFLEVVGKRPDGFHDLETYMIPISMFDTLRVRRAVKTRVTFDVPVPAVNTVTKAIDAVRDLTEFRGGVEVRVTKRIPMEAGLGGGSSDGASTILALDRLLGLKLTMAEKLALAARVGSDVPFFMAEGPACCFGRGEIVVGAPAPAKRRFVVVKPRFSLSTKRVFAAMGRVSRPRPLDLRRRFNRLEEPSYKLRPELREIRDTMRRAGYADAMMTGSGSALFAEDRGPRALSALRRSVDCDKIALVSLWRR